MYFMMRINDNTLRYCSLNVGVRAALGARTDRRVCTKHQSLLTSCIYDCHQ